MKRDGAVDEQARIKLQLIDSVTKEVLSEQSGRGSLNMLAFPPLAPPAEGSEDEPKKYILEGTLDRYLWDIPEVLCSKLPFIQPNPDKETAEPPVEDLERPKSLLSWTLQVSSTSEFVLAHDKAQENEWAAAREQWEIAEPGRAERAAECRRKYLEERAAQKEVSVMSKTKIVRRTEHCIVEAAAQEAFVSKLDESIEAWKKDHEANILEPRLACVEIRQKQMEDEIALLKVWREDVKQSCDDAFIKRKSYMEQHLEAKSAASTEPEAQ
jgi:hypothetical protein